MRLKTSTHIKGHATQSCRRLVDFFQIFVLLRLKTMSEWILKQKVLKIIYLVSSAVFTNGLLPFLSLLLHRRTCLCQGLHGRKKTKPHRLSTLWEGEGICFY